MLLVELPHFFKVVTSPNDVGVKFPDGFMRKYGGELRKVVLLKVPTGGRSWQVELVHCGNRCLMQKGWQEFAEFYSIKFGHFLVFQYEGNSQFLVLMFDTRAVEVDYPSKVNSEVRSGSRREIFGERGSSPCVGSELNVDDEVREEDEEEKVHQTTRTKGKICPRTRSSRRKTENTQFRSMKGVKEEEGSAGTIWRSLPTSSTNTPSCKTKIIEELKSYQESRSSRPFFISFMQPSYVSNLFRMSVPMDFVKKHLSIKKDCKFMFHVSGNTRKWPVILKVYGEPKPRRIRIYYGFSKFVKDNNLKVGDICVFELGQGSQEFKVTVYPSGEHDQMVA